MRARSRVVLAAGTLLALTAIAAAKPDRKELDQLLADTDAMVVKVSTIRGLAVKKPIARGVMAREQIEQHVLQRIGEEYTDAKLAAEERVAKRFGMLPADMDYKKTMMALLTEQISGFYDPTAKQLYLADWIDVAMQKLVMAHEICHALQDQSFDLDKFLKAVRDNADATLARQALVEGDGVAVMIEFMFREMGVKVDPWVDDTVTKTFASQASGMGPGMETLAKAPLALRESLMFPYVSGLKLVAFTRRHHPWSRVDEMFKKPPASTEQILHPEKYFAGEKPVTVKLGAPASLKKWKIVEQNVLGEATFGWLWRQHGVRDARANDAAAGWGGDRYVAYAPPGDDGTNLESVVLISASTWDTETDANEAFEVALEAMPTWLGVKTPIEKTATLARFQHPSGALSFVERKGQKLLIVVGQPDKMVKLRTELWGKWR